jgi:hypothetical protein
MVSKWKPARWCNFVVASFMQNHLIRANLLFQAHDEWMAPKKSPLQIALHASAKRLQAVHGPDEAMLQEILVISILVGGCRFTPDLRGGRRVHNSCICRSH